MTAIGGVVAAPGAETQFDLYSPSSRGFAVPEEAETLAGWIDQIQHTIWCRRIDAEVVVANNGSTDGSSKLRPSMGRTWSTFPPKATVRHCGAESQRPAAGS